MKNKFLKILLMGLLVAIVAVAFNKYGFVKSNQNKVSVEKWDNLYSEGNIKFYYQDKADMNIQNLKETFKLKELVKNEKDDLKKALVIMKWLGEKVKYNPNSMSNEDFAIETIKKAEENTITINDQDYCSIYTEVATAAGLNVRKGELRVKEANKDKKKYNHFVCEVWSDKYNKWIMLDPSNLHYITNKGEPISVMEVISKRDDNIEILGGSDSKKYIKNLKKYLYSYTIPIDNSIYGIRKSNSFITYINKGDLPEIYIKDSLIKPTIFTDKQVLFNISPKIKYQSEKAVKKDTVPTLIFSERKSEKDKEKDKEKVHLYGGVFKDSVMEEKYYISINGGQWKEVNKYFEMTLLEGKNTIKLSMDKEKVQREVVINYNLHK
ncbi:transglutaminase domain-containing protein [Clostridium sp. KNHs214]|uniref:transglutaminase domain-containing protein n=1 Tax=Clostridium sp. KNHs214 TaxID=1540257 RepID=UPI000690EA24|nr:transglutaminase domain-containing protein [Clostridium sp. KNHs214]